MTFTAKPKYLEIEAPTDLIPPMDEDGAPFKATIRVNLTLGETRALNLSGEKTWEALFRLFAPYVVAWNVARINDAGESVPVPPPAEGGPAMFEHLPADVVNWLVVRVKFENYQVRSAEGAPGAIGRAGAPSC